MSNDKEKNESEISDHKQFKKELKPPLLQINMTSSSWIDERLPEMLWAVLVIGNMERENALSFFRHIANYVSKNQDCYNVTLTGISKFTEEKRTEFIGIVTSWSSEIKNSLRPLIIFPNLPAINDWKNFLDTPIPKDDWQKYQKGA